MAEGLAAVAGVASVAGLADICCRLATTLYKFSEAVKDAPRNIQALAQRLEALRKVLEEVDGLLKRYPTSSFVIEDGFSIQSLEVMWQACHAELVKVGASIARFTNVTGQTGRLREARRRFNWAWDERKIDKHCGALQELSHRINTALSTAGRHHDITARANGKALEARVGDVRTAVQICETRTGDRISTECATIQSSVSQIATKVTGGQNELQTHMRVAQDHISRRISQTRKTSIQAIGAVRHEIRKTSFINRRNQQRVNRQLQKLNQSRSQMSFMLNELPSLQLKSQGSDSDSDIAQYMGLEDMAFTLLHMRPSLDKLITRMQATPSLKVSDDEAKFLLDEFELLVAFYHGSAAFSGRDTSNSDEDQRLGCKDTVLVRRNYSPCLKGEHLPKTMQRVYRRQDFRLSQIGRLEVKFEESVDDGEEWPTFFHRASFHFVPNGNSFSAGIYASFRKDFQMARKPCITRTLREVRIWHGEEALYEQVIHVLETDDLVALKRMLSFGEIRPWDCFNRFPGDTGDGNLLEMAALCLDSRQVQSQILEYLLHGAWDVENSRHLQGYIWLDMRISTMEIFKFKHQASVKALELGQTLDHDFFELLPAHGMPTDSLANDEQNEYLCKTLEFFIKQGLSIESRNDLYGETPLLSIAEADTWFSVAWLCILLEYGADITAVDYKGRGPLHLTLKRCRSGTETLLPLSFMMKEKLILLLRAGCSIHSVDDYGRTPNDQARETSVKYIWMSALEETGMLDEDIKRTLYEKPPRSIFDDDVDDSFEKYRWGDEQLFHESDSTDADDDSVGHVSQAISSRRGSTDSATSEVSTSFQQQSDDIIRSGQHHLWM